ncbi:hypothetical protein [Nocardioides sp. LHG3406-4]|uniref:hypothetical protein n=1 Tax=Nocardioides sp. LHG3406-4 TaxID=2804575 RepID=UPI003CED530F
MDSPEVQAAIAAKVTEALQQQVDVEAILNEAFAGVITERPRLEALVGPLAGAINGLIDSQVRAFIASDTFDDFWVTANTRLQQALVRVLEGNETGAVSQQGDQVVLDVTEVIDQVKQRLVDRGLTIVENLPIPDADRQIVLFDAPQLRQARTTYAFLHPVATWLIAVVAGLYLAAVVLSRRRPRMTVIVGVVLAANSLLVAWALSAGRQLFVDSLSDTEFGPAGTSIFDTLLSFLMRGQRVLLWLGLILVIAGWFAGRTTFATAFRRTLGGGLETAGAALAGGPTVGPGRWVAANAAWLRVVVGVLGAVVLLWGNEVSESRLVWALVLVVALLMVVQILIGTGNASRRAGTPSGDNTNVREDGTDPLGKPGLPGGETIPARPRT